MGGRAHVAQVAAWAHAPGGLGPVGEHAEALGAWTLRPTVVLVLLVMAGLYALGSWRLTRRRPGTVGRTRIAWATAGLLAIAAALLSPLDALADHLFRAHMVQHMLLVMVAAPALLLADPFPIAVWALSGRARRSLRRWLVRRSIGGRTWRLLTGMQLAWIAYACVLWAWHLPVAYDAALSDRGLHDLEHLTLFVGAILFWWPVIDPAPHFRSSAAPAVRVAYLVLGAVQTAALGLLLTLAPVVLYRSYASATGAADSLADQAAGGIVMWGLGGLIDMIAILVLVYRALGAGRTEVRREERRSRRARAGRAS